LREPAGLGAICPEQFRALDSVDRRFARWSKAGQWQSFSATLFFAALSRDAQPKEVFIDSTSVRAHQQAAGAQEKPGRKRSGATSRLSTQTAGCRSSTAPACCASELW
jgi:hypothetical protein